MKKLALLAALIAPLASAQTATLTATASPPATLVGGATIPASGPGSLLGITFEVGTCVSGAFGTMIGSLTDASAPFTVTFNNLVYGTSYGVRAYATNSAGNSAYAVPVTPCYSPTPGVPNPPVFGAVTTAAVEVRFGDKGYWIVRNVGTVPLGTPCSPGVYIDRPGKQADYYAAANPANVTYSVNPTTITGVVALRCEAV